MQMFNAEHLQEKWAPLLNYEGLDPIKDSHRRAVTAVLLENQEKFLREEREFLYEAGPTNSAGTGGFSNTASFGSSSISGGRQALADRWGMRAYSAGQFAAQGDAQHGIFVLRCITTTNTAVEMALDGVTTYLTIPSGKVMAMNINISGVSSDGSAVAHYLRQYAVKNVAGTSSQVYAPVTIGTDNAAGTSIALSVNDTDDSVRIAVTGVVSQTWRWVATVDAVEIGYGT